MRDRGSHSLASSITSIAIAVSSLLFVALHSSFAPRAMAETGGTTQGNRIVAGVQFGTPPNSYGKDGSDCTWTLFYDFSNSNTPPPVEPPLIIDGDFTFVLWLRSCPFGWEAHWIPDVDRETLGEVAKSRLTKLVPSLPIATAPPTDRMVIGVGSWFWVPPPLWVTISVTAWVPTPSGVLSVTTEAEPRELIYSPGDGAFGSGAVRCDGPGTPWLQIFGDKKDSACMYTYRHSSSLSRDHAFHASITTVWEVSWSSNLGIGGRLPDLETSSNVTVQVRELQALIR